MKQKKEKSQATGFVEDTQGEIDSQIPLRLIDDKKPQVKREPTHTGESPKNSIILAHEKDIFRHQLFQTLYNEGYHVKAVETAQDAVSILYRHDPEKTVLIIQNEIPSKEGVEKFDGFGVLKTAEKIGVDTARLKKIMISNENVDEARLTAFGIQKFRLTPVDPKIILADVQSFERLTN